MSVCALRQWRLDPHFSSLDDFRPVREVRPENGANNATVTSSAPGSKEAEGHDCNVLRVVYPAGSTAPRHKNNVGGLNFYAQPLSIDSTARRVKTTTTLSYEVRFSDDFDWVKGGKLPGLYGGRGASGGLREDQDLEAGFSARLMWRAEVSAPGSTPPTAT